MAGHPKIVIVGAGIIGASIAWHLARSGARVTVIDAAEPGGVATRNSWAWINASWGHPAPYFRLRVCAMQEWRRLERELPNIRVAWTGGLNWELPAERLRAFAAQHADWGYDIRCVDRDEARRIEPNLADPPAFAVHAPGEGAVEPLVAAQHLLSAARSLGATVVANTTVRSLHMRAGRIVGVQTEAGRLDADQVVIAAGAGAVALGESIGLALPIAAPPALLAITKPLPKLLGGLVMTPDMQLRQAIDGRLVATASMKTADTHARAIEILDAMQSLLRPAAALQWDSWTAGHRPIPPDGLPLIGCAEGIDGLHVAVTHSGVTLAPALGRFVAEEIIEGHRHPLLAPFGLERLSKR